MAKYVAITLLFALCLSMVFSIPLPEQEEQEEGIIRQKRVTCDLLSAQVGGFAFNHAACAAHCIALRRRGGSCQSGVCVCRS